MPYDIIPDIHGQADKLTGMLGTLGYEKKLGVWWHPEPDRQIVFLGDFIDRGPDNRKVIEIVRGLIDAGRALAVMGNHELNAIHFHSNNPQTRKPLRKHSAKNLRQHASFLVEFPIGNAETREAVDWMARLPLWLDVGPFRAVHACWDEGAIERVGKLAPDGVLSPEQLMAAANRSRDLFADVDVLTKGPEVRLPDGYSFHDKNGEERFEVRLAWWRAGAATWKDAAMLVPNASELPTGQLPPGCADMVYPEDAKPVFFGHYWLTDGPLIEAPNTCCLDCSAGTDGPLMAYRFEESAGAISKDGVVGVSPR